MDIDLICGPAYLHESNGVVEPANLTFPSYFHHVRLCDKRSLVAKIALEARHGTIITRGSPISSAFELMFNRSPRLSGSEDQSFDLTFCTSVTQENDIPSLQQYAALVRSIRIQTMLGTQNRDQIATSVDDMVYF